MRKIYKKIREHKVAVSIVFIFTFLVGLGSALGAFQTLFSVATKVLPRHHHIQIDTRESSQTGLDKISAGMQIDRMSEVLNKKPEISRSFKGIPYKEYIYIFDSFYLQAISDSDGQVVIYAVTSRSQDFNPIWPENNLFKVQLGKTVFADIHENPYAIRAFEGVRRHGYFEFYYFGGGSSYQTVAVGLNDAGFTPWYGATGLETPVAELGTMDFSNPTNIQPIFDLLVFRKKATVNTYAVSISHAINDNADLLDAISYLGPDLDTVSTIK
jgi:hypothetical protein